MANIFELLDLQIDPKPSFGSVEEVKDLIEKRKRKLSRMGGSGAKKVQIDKLTAFSQAVTLERMEQEHANALRDAKKHIEKHLKFVAPDGELSEDKAEAAAKKFRVTVAFIFREFPNIKPAKKKREKELAVPKCKNKMSKQVEDWLVAVKRNDLYDFLCGAGSGNRYLEYRSTLDERRKMRLLPSEQLCAAAKELYGELERNPDNDVKSAGTKLARLCQEIFADEASKKDYDTYVNFYVPLSDVLKQVPVVAENNSIQPRVGEALVQEINKVVRDVEESRAYLRGRCKEQNIVWVEVADTSIANCVFCGEKIGVDDEVCGHCGKKQYIICPKCKAKSRAGSGFCTSCGQKFGDSKRAGELCDAAEKEIEQLNFSVAEHFLRQAESEGADSQTIKALRENLDRVKAEVGEQVSRIEECKSRRAYYEANSLMADVKKMYPGYQNNSLELVIRDVMKRADELFAKAGSTEDEEKCLELCDQLDKVCSDYPGLEDLRNKFPPEQPESVTVRKNEDRRTNEIFWEYSGISSGVSFTVVRKEFSLPANVGDGTVIGTYSSRSCTDSHPEGGREYYYAVFAVRGGQVSAPGVTSEYIINLFDVENFSVNPEDSVVQFSWKNTSGGTVRIWRKEDAIPQEPGDGTEISNITSSGVWDNQVKNGTTYGYLVCVEYRAGGEKFYSRGLTCRVVPDVTPPEVTYLLVHMSVSDRKRFELEWDDDIEESIHFYASREPLAWPAGTVISEVELKSIATQMNVTAKRPGCGQMEIGAIEEGYLTAVTQGRENMVIGASAFFSNRQIFKVTEARLIHGDIHIFMDEWPKECGSMKVMYQSKGYPQTVTAKDAESIIVTRAVFNQTGTVVIKGAQPVDYYISMFGKMSGDRGYAPPVYAKFSNCPKCILDYDFSVKKSLLGKIKEVELRISCEEDIWTLPELVVQKNAGFLPPATSVGSSIMTIASKENLQGKKTISLGGDFRENDYIRLFFKNDSDNEHFELNATGALKI